MHQRPGGCPHDNGGRPVDCTRPGGGELWVCKACAAEQAREAGAAKAACRQPDGQKCVVCNRVVAPGDGKLARPLGYPPGTVHKACAEGRERRIEDMIDRVRGGVGGCACGR